MGATYTYNPDDPDNPVENELSDEEKAHNEAVFASYRKLSSALENIDGLNVVNKLWGSRISDDSSAYPLSLQAQGRRQYNYADAHDFYINLGYTMEEITVIRPQTMIYAVIATVFFALILSLPAILFVYRTDTGKKLK